LNHGKETVASLQTSSKLSKAIKMVKSPKLAYTFVESIMAPELVDEFLKRINKSII
jgi:ribosome-binding factor A